MPISENCQFAELLKILRIIEGGAERNTLASECDAALFQAIQAARRGDTTGEVTLKLVVDVEDGRLVVNHVVRSIAKAKLTEGKGAGKVDLDVKGQLVFDLDDSDDDTEAA